MIPLPFLGLGGDVGTGLRLAGGVGISGLIRLVDGVGITGLIRLTGGVEGGDDPISDSSTRSNTSSGRGGISS